ncbi:hypothetical protein [Aeromonas hydrophila]
MPVLVVEIVLEPFPITENEAIGRITKICSEKNFQFIRFKDGWKNIQSKLLLTCHCGRQWDPSFTSIVHIDSGCPTCAKSGYDSSRSGWLYCHLWTNPDTGHRFLKYGITNHPKQRIQQQKCNTKYKPKQLCSIPFTDGKIPENLEKAIDEFRKTNNIANPVTKTEFPDGFSETLPLSCWSFIANLVQNETMCRLQPIQQ